MAEGKDLIEWPTYSVIHLEFEIPKADSNRLYMVAGKPEDPFLEAERMLSRFLNGSDVRLIGFKIVD